MTSLMIWFQDNSETATLWTCDDQLKLIGDLPFDEIASHTGDAPVRGFFQTEHVSFIQCLLPKTSEKRLRLALPGLLEDQIASSPEDNLYALPMSYQAGELATVAVTHLNTVQHMVAVCKQAGINLVSLAPDCFLLPAPTDGSIKMIQPDRVVVRTGLYEGFALPTQHAVLLMRELEAVNAVEPRLSDEIPYNILQAQFTSKHPKKPMGRIAWLYVGLAGLVGVHFISLIIVGAVLSSRVSNLKAQNLDFYAQVFPGATKVNSPKVLIERELQQYGSGVQGPLLKLVSDLSQALMQAPGGVLNSLDYSHGRLTADLTLPNMDSLETLNKGLIQTGVKSEQQVTQHDNTILVQLVIHSGENK